MEIIISIIRISEKINRLKIQMGLMGHQVNTQYLKQTSTWIPNKLPNTNLIGKNTDDAYENQNLSTSYLSTWIIVWWKWEEWFPDFVLSDLFSKYKPIAKDPNWSCFFVWTRGSIVPKSGRLNPPNKSIEKRMTL